LFSLATASSLESFNWSLNCIACWSCCLISSLN
jgi:hypothetical protein